VEYAFFSVAQGTFSKIDHILGHKASIIKYNKIKIIFHTLSQQKGIKSTSIAKETTECIQIHGV
jgi:hypothetical protein